jgi:hypothetical protein
MTLNKIGLQTGQQEIDTFQMQMIFFSIICVQTGSEAHPASYPVS